MPIFNVNAFQNGINQKDFLTSYTDVYLKQSLANLSQRTAAKGDSIGFSSFNMKELFPNYTGDFNANNLIIEAIEYPEENKVEGYLRLLSKEGKTISLSEDEANTKFIVNNINNILNGIGNEYNENHITISDVSTINNVDYWHKESAVIASTGNSFIYKLVGHKKGGLYGEESNKGYDNEYICEEIDNNGKFVEGFRVFIINENNLMYNEEKVPSTNLPEDVYERLGLLHLYKQKDSKGNEVWKLSVYKVGQYENTNISLGDIIGQTDSIFYDLIKTQLDTDGSLSPSDIISGILNSSLSSIIKKLYTVDVDYDNTNNASWSVSTDYINSTWKLISDANSLCGTGNKGQLKEDSTKTGILGDIDIICGNSLQGTNSKLEYFAYDLSTLYPRVLEIFNEIMYKDSTNLKIKKRIISTLVHSCRTNFLNQLGKETNNLYAVYFPITYEVKYNCNSNDLSQIYNLTSSIPVYFGNILNKLTDNSIVINPDSIESLKKIAYHFDTTDDPSNYVIAHSIIEKTVLYDLFLSYTDDDIISSFVWTINFTMPYISEDGYWVINDIKTTNYAKGKVEDQANLIMMASTNPDEFVASSHILTGAGMANLKAQGSDMFEKKVFKSNYLQSNTNVDSANLYNMQAWVPSDKYLLSIKDTDEFSYLRSSVVMAISSTSMEKDATTIQYAYYDTNYSVQEGIVTGTYDEVKIIYDGNKYFSYGYTDWKVKNDVVSYIYRIEENSNSINGVIGNNGIITSFWTCQQKNDIYGATYWSFDYIRKPEDKNEVALDFNYIGNLEQYVKYYTKLRFSPDDYEHSQLVFDSAVVLLKNNTSDSKISRVWPVFINHLCDYYNNELGTDPSRALGDSTNLDETQYYNQLNFGLEFVDQKNVDNDGHIISIENSNNRRFKIDTYTTTDPQIEAYEYNTYDNGNTINKNYRLKNINHTYGIIPNVIPYTVFNKEYIPNAEYDINNNFKGNQYPFFDMKEVLLKNVTTLNRNNIFGVEKKKFGTTTYGVIYNAYIGTAFDNDDKSILHIGTSNINPNMGTTTMTDSYSITYLTKMEGISIDFDNIYLNGHTIAEINTNKPIWNYNKTSNGIVTYSTILYPIDEVQIYKPINNIPDYHNDLLSVEILSNNYNKKSKYYNVIEDEYISYLNVNKLLSNSNIIIDGGSTINGDLTRLSTRTNTSEQLTYYLKLSSDLTNKENYIYNGKNADNTTYYIVQTNPIELSYTDIVAYDGSMNINAYTYVYTYLSALSYTEYWYCEGCELCNEGICNMIKQCNKSSCKGYWVPSYQYAKIKEGEDFNLILNSSYNTYTYYHERYRKINNNYEKYDVLSYYPVTETLSENDFSDIELFKSALKRNNKGIEEKLTYWLDEKSSTGQYVWMYPTSSYTEKEIEEHISSTIPVPRNIISSYIHDYIKENETEENVYTIEGNKIKNSKGEYIKFTYNNVYTYNYDVDVNGIKYNAIKYQNEEKYADSIFSYLAYDILTITSSFSRRFINIREILSSHTLPKYFNDFIK